MNVLSLFDGMSCGQIALDQLGIKIDNYYAAEIDKYAIEIAKKNYPNTIHLGDVTKIKGEDLPQIDLLIGGSPCQGFSVAGTQLNFDDPRSALFFDYVRLLKETKPKYFLLENVRMKKDWENVISEYLNVEPIIINSSCVSAQNRVRLYWTNIPNIQKPEDKNILLKDIIENGIASDEMITKNKKSYCVTATYAKAVPSNSINKKQRTMIKILDSNDYRKLTPVECERLQTVPDGYTEGVSNSQRYKMLGNGWTVEVIKHIFKNMEV